MRIPTTESLMTGGTIAHYLAAGVEVVVVTSHPRREGEVIEGAVGLARSPTWRRRPTRRIPDRRARRRAGSAEPDQAAPLAPRFLGGAGR